MKRSVESQARSRAQLDAILAKIGDDERALGRLLVLILAAQKQKRTARLANKVVRRPKRKAAR